MKTSQLGHSLILLLTAVIWGVAFVAQSVGMDYVGPFTFTCARPRRSVISTSLSFVTLTSSFRI